jgi:hypothetical protein
MLNAANMYPWYRDSMSQLGQFCAGNNLTTAAAAAAIKTENGYNDCMLALDYAHNKVSLFPGLHLAKKSSLVGATLSVTKFIIIVPMNLVTL